MTTSHWTERAASLEAEIARANANARLSLQPRLQKVINHLEADGVRIPTRLKKLNAKLIDEVTEARFDNMPV